MTRPRHITIGDRRIAVHFRRRPLSEDDERGLYWSFNKTIEIAPGLGQPLTRKTLLHECMHAVLDAAGVADKLSLDIEEIVCESAERLIDLFDQNPELTEYLTYGPKGRIRNR